MKHPLPTPTRMLPALILLLLSACAPKTSIPWHLDTQYLRTLYRTAVEDARTATPNEISTSLIAITQPGDDPRMEWSTDARVLVASLMPPAIADRFVPGTTTIATEELTWVTIPYDLSDHAVAFEACADSLQLRIRLLQLLGLPPDDGSDRIAFFYVRSQDLRRPTPDPEVDDCTASLHFPENTPEHYRTWFAANTDFSYNSSTPYPWTRLGYTYDWHNADRSNANSSNIHVQGLSEFIVHPGAKMEVQRVTGIWSWYLSSLSPTSFGVDP